MRSAIWLLLMTLLSLVKGRAQTAQTTQPIQTIPDFTRDIPDYTAGFREDFGFVHGGLQLGPVLVRPRLSASVTYDDNIYINRGRQQEDIIYAIIPGLSATLGQDENSVSFDYIARLNFFMEESQNNSLDHQFDLSAQYRLKKLSLGLRQGITIASGGVVDVGTRVTRNIYTTALSSHYELSGKTSVEVNATQIVSDYDQYLSSREWANQDWLNYQILPKINAGLGVTLGYREIQNNPHQTYEQFLVRALYNLSGKTDLQATFGGEWRQFGGEPGGFGPVFTVAFNYQPFDATSLSLSAYRRDQNSAFLAGQNFTTTGFTGTVRQRFFQRIYVSLGVGYDNLSYHSTQSGVTATREDNVSFIRFGVDWNLTRRLLMGVFYLHRENDSNQVPFSNNQVTLQTTFAF